VKTILQVDDDPNDVYLLQHAMKKVGVANPVQVVSDGQQAIDYLQGAGKFCDREKFPVPCLLLMDLKLPHVMGLDVLRWIRTQPRTPLMVIMLTASAEDSDIAEAYRLGANAFLTKPSEASKLEDMVRAIKAFWLTHNTLPPDPLRESYQQRTLTLVLPGRTLPVAKSLFHTDGVSDRTCNGNGLLGPLLAGPSARQRQPHGPTTRVTAAPPLTKRQREVLRLIAEGFSNRQMGRQMSVSIKTVEKHRQSLMDKLNIHQVAKLTRYAVSSGVVESNLAPTGRIRSHGKLVRA
jgi:DNA-binding NarL/FixJ family response regulator